MAIDRHGIKSLLLENKVKQDRVKRAMNLISRLLLEAEGIEELLKSADEITEREALTALRSLYVEDRVQKIILVSQSKPFPKPDWMTKRVYEQTCREFKETRFWGMPMKTLSSTLGSTFWNSLVNALERPILDRLIILFKETPETMVMHYVGFLIAGPGHEREVKALEKIVELQVKGWVLMGIKKEQPRCWLVLVA